MRWDRTLVAIHLTLCAVVFVALWLVWAIVPAILGAALFAWFGKKEMDRAEHFRQRRIARGGSDENSRRVAPCRHVSGCTARAHFSVWRI